MHRLIPDPFAGQPQGLQIGLQIAFVIFGVLCAWIALDTRRALKKLVSLGPASRLKINPERPVWIWFYRIDAAVVSVSVAVTLLAHWFARS